MNKNAGARRIYRPCKITFRVSEKERSKIEEEANKRFQQMSDFIRVAILSSIFNTGTPNAMDSEILTEISELNQLIQKMNSEKLDMKHTLEILANRPKEFDLSLEQKILMHLKGRKLPLNILSEYCLEQPPFVLEMLSKLKKEGKVQRNNQKRWYIE